MNLDRVLAAASLIIGAASLIAGYYFYRLSLQQRDPTAMISPERTSIVNSAAPELSDLTVLFKGKQIEEKTSPQ